MTRLFEEIVYVSKKTLEDWQLTIAFIQSSKAPDGTKFNLEETMPSTGHELAWFDERMISICNLVNSLEKVEADKSSPLPESYYDDLESKFIDLKDDVLIFKSIVGQFQDDDSVSSISPDTWEIVLSGTNQVYNLASHFQSITGKIESTLISFYSVAAITGSKKFDAFAEAVREHSNTLEASRASADEISQLKKEVSKYAIKVTTLTNQIEKLTSQATESTQNISDNETNSHDSLERIDTLISGIDETSNQASELKGNIESYSTDFENFQETLDERNTKYQTLRNDMERLLADLDGEQSKINQITENANKMLEGATNAGLASAFKDALNELEPKVENAKKSFYNAIGGLALFALPLVIYITVMTAGGSEGLGELSPATTVSLAVLMLPMAWLVKFAANRHHQLFQLKEHYLFKYTVAMSVEGFKQQAPEHADAIAAESFNRLLFNPADKLDGNGGEDHPSPLMNWLMNKLGFNSKGISISEED